MSVYPNQTLQKKVTYQFAGRPGSYPAQAMNDEVSGVPFASTVPAGTMVEFGTPVVWDVDGFRAVKAGDTNIYGVLCFNYQVLADQKGFTKDNLSVYATIKRKGYVTVKMDTLAGASVDSFVTLDAANGCYKLATAGDLVYGRIDTLYPEYGTAMIEMCNITAANFPAVAARGVLTISGLPEANNTVTIGDTTYKFVAELTGANDILIGESVATSIQALTAAVNGAEGAGTLYGAGTEANASVVASYEGNKMTVIAKAAGVAGNAIATTVGGDNLSFGAGTLTGGKDAA